MTRPPPLSIFNDAVAAEKGRLLAAQAMMLTAESRQRVEAMYGLEYCKQRYPEVYAPPSRFGRILEKLKFVGRR